MLKIRPGKSGPHMRIIIHSHLLEILVVLPVVLRHPSQCSIVMAQMILPVCSHAAPLRRNAPDHIIATVFRIILKEINYGIGGGWRDLSVRHTHTPNENNRLPRFMSVTWIGLDAEIIHEPLPIGLQRWQESGVRTSADVVFDGPNSPFLVGGGPNVIEYPF